VKRTSPGGAAIEGFLLGFDLCELSPFDCAQGIPSGVEGARSAANSEKTFRQSPQLDVRGIQLQALFEGGLRRVATPCLELGFGERD